jgi:dihydropteroate synthase
MNSVLTSIVSTYNPTILNIESKKDAEQAIKNIQSDPESIPIMTPKMIHRVIQLENINLQDAIIIKQDMLSIGGEVAVPKHTFQLTGEPASILIMGTYQQLNLLVQKLNRHYPRIKSIASELDEILQTII